MARNSKKTVEDITRVTVGLINQRGYKNVSAELICAEAGISKSTFYYHFDSVVHVLDELFYLGSGNADEFTAWMYSGKTYLEKLVRYYYLINRKICQINDREAITDFLIFQSSGKGRMGKEDMDFFKETMSHLIFGAQKAGEIRSTADAKDLARIALSMEYGFFLIEARTHPDRPFSYRNYIGDLIILLDQSSEKIPEVLALFDSLDNMPLPVEVQT